jgi:PAS domain S-box-containing protein
MWDPLSIYRPGNRSKLLATAGCLIAVVALVDWATDPFISLGFLYLFPLMMVGGVLGRWQIVAVAALCAGLGEAFANLPSHELAVRLGLTFTGFAGTGLFVSELVRNRRMVAVHVEELEDQNQRRRDAEDQLRALIETSPAAIVTVDGAGRIEQANEAARHVLAPAGESLTGQAIAAYLPALQAVVQAQPSRTFRTTLQCTGRRSGGGVFLAGVWFSSYVTPSGPRVAAIIVDISDEARSREDMSLDHLLRHSRIVVSAVAHEIRNLCGATLVTHKNLSRVPALQGNEDFQALGTLLRGLEKVAEMELAPTAGVVGTPVDVRSALEELRVLTAASLEEAGTEAQWSIPADLPLAWADRYGLIQVFLNLVRNSQRAMEQVEVRRLLVAADVEDGQIVVRVEDTGPGVQAPEDLFRPFQRGAGGTGLGLYVSRTLLRSFGGELTHVPRSGGGACFAVRLGQASEAGSVGREATHDVHA